MTDDSVHFFSILQFCGHTLCAHLLKLQTIMHNAKATKASEHHSAVVTLSVVILVSARINSALCTVASIAFSTGQPGQASTATSKGP
jgi:hypothetical protein